MGTTEGTEPVEKSTATFSFVEAGQGYSVGRASRAMAERLADATPQVALNDFFARPVRIGSFTWSDADVLGLTRSFNPWSLYFTSPPIADKLVNYAFLKCDLKVKIMVNASPFYYGSMLASYQPLPTFHPSGVVVDSGTRFVIPFSQRPHIWLYPQNNEGGEMTLPFFLHKNWLETSLSSDFVGMGALSLTNVVGLATANGVVGPGVVVSIYAWAENVELSGPTSGLLLQSDEYGKGSVSSMATAIAASMRALEHVPVIGPYATATQMGAAATASVAASLGFCNPPVISDVMAYKPISAPPLASTEISYPVEKLTIDPKNELSVDPGVVGLPGVDELNIKYLVEKESYLTSFPWVSTDSTDALLFSSVLNPTYYDREGTTNPKLYLTPMAWVAQLFEYWRGDIILRFRFICTQYHRGRVRITFDPAGDSMQNVLNQVNTQATCFNEVVDLTKDTNVEVRVPYAQALSWSRTIAPSGISFMPYTVGGGTAFNHVRGTTNGVLTVRCLTSLTAPTTSAAITCMVSVRGAENLEFAAPRTITQRYSTFAPQSDDYELTPSVQVAISAPSRPSPSRFLVNHGEQIVSLRQLLHRYSFVRSQFIPPSGLLGHAIVDMYRMPPSYGYDPTGIGAAKGIVLTANNYTFNWCGQSALTWLTPAFIGVRGSVNWMVNSEGAIVAKTVLAGRQTTPLVAAAFSSLDLGVSPNAVARSCAFLMGESMGGAALTNQLTNATLTFQAPMYSAYKMNSTTPRNATATVSVDDTSTQGLRIVLSRESNSAGLGGVLHMYASAGTDFSLLFFLNVPTLHQYTNPPVAV